MKALFIFVILLIFTVLTTVPAMAQERTISGNPTEMITVSAFQSMVQDQLKKQFTGNAASEKMNLQIKIEDQIRQSHMIVATDEEREYMRLRKRAYVVGKDDSTLAVAMKAASTLTAQGQVALEYLKKFK